VIGVVAIGIGLAPRPPVDLASQYITESVSVQDLAVTVDANGQLTSVSSDNEKAVIRVSEYDVAKLKDDQKVTLTIGALDKSVEGTVSSISDRADSTTGVQTYSVTIEMKSLPSGSRVGMSVNASVTTRTAKGVIAIPASAVADSEGEQTVKVLKNNQVLEVTVETGVVAGSLVEITNGLEEGDKLVTGTNGNIPTIGGSGGFMPPAPGGVAP
jgi:multidrug efflux pump subunit AcrA (membrane-fusion protein)